jgi:outer membrane protein assembly factor BamB
VDGGVVYVGTYAGDVVALDSSSGDIVWSVSLGSAIYASPAVDGSAVYINGIDGSLHALDRETGEARWMFEMGSPAYSSASVSGEVVYALSERGGWLYALAAADGIELWRVVTGYEGDWRASTPVPVNGMLFIGSNRDGLLVFRQAN